MRVRAKVKTNQKIEKVEQLGNLLNVWVKASATAGKANKNVCEVVTKHFNVSKSSVKIISGHKSNFKTVEVNV